MREKEQVDLGHIRVGTRTAFPSGGAVRERQPGDFLLAGTNSIWGETSRPAFSGEHFSLAGNSAKGRIDGPDAE